MCELDFYDFKQKDGTITRINKGDCFSRLTVEKIYKIKNFYDIEFIELLNDEEYENLEAVFTISGYPSTEILIYSRDTFSYNSKMYKIVSNENFSEVINYYYLFQAKN